MKKLLVTFGSIGIVLIVGGVAYSLGFLDPWLKAEQTLMTYYQWTDSEGNVYITQSPPAGNTQYISFKSTDNLMASEHPVDPEVLNEAEAFLQARNQKNQSNTANSFTATFESQSQSVECRWLVGRIQEIKRLVKSAEHLDKSKRCKEYYKRRRELNAKGCDTSYSQSVIKEC